MASTVTQVVTQFRDGGFYPDCPLTIAHGLFEDAIKWLTWKLRLRTASLSISLTQGVREVPLAADVLAIREAYFEPSGDPSTWHVLEGTTIDLLARRDPGWRSAGARGVPHRYFVDQASDGDSGHRILGFDPVPNESTDDGYPRVRIYVVQFAELTGSETIPHGIYTDDVLLYEMAYRWAVRQDPGRVAQWKALRDEAVSDNNALNKTIVDEAPSQIFLSPFTHRTSRTI